MAAIGAISIINYLEIGYVAGFAFSWWGFTSALVLLIITVSGWVIYRFRSTRCLTLSQFFEKRYSRKFRIFTGIVAFIAGIINFGIFPAVGARFFIYFCGLPTIIFGVPTFPLIMIILLSISLFFVFSGGQVAVMIADFFQGIFVNITIITVVLFLFFNLSWEQVTYALEQTPINLANEEIKELKELDSFSSLSDLEKTKEIQKINEKYENSSRINPFKTSEVEDFNFIYFIIAVFGVMYAAMSWQGTQGYNASAKSAHEAKMGSVLGIFRQLPIALFFVFVPVAIYVYMNHPDFITISNSVQLSMNTINNETLQGQLRGPLVLSTILPSGLLGLFAAMMLAAFISTHDTYLHSWGSIFIQDVIMPFRKEPFDKDTHLKVLRLSIFGVAIFIFFFSLLFQQNQKIALFFAITAAIFAGGSGAVIIGGLYWKRGTAAAAWTAMILGAIIAVMGVIIKQIPDTWIFADPNLSWFKSLISNLKAINGQVYWAIGMSASSLSYILVSLIGKKRIFNLDKLLFRGKYANESGVKIVNKNSGLGWKALGMGKEFTKIDKFIYLLNYIWAFGWVIVFIIGTIYNLSNEVSNQSWMNFWKYYVLINIAMSILCIIWFTWGGFKDLTIMMKKLRETERDHSDDGWVNIK
jgi:SSS family solute:Na+ symporter